MKKITFSKYQGAGNDFVLIDNRNGEFDRSDNALVQKLCDRRFGIGADGLMLLQHTKNNSDAHDFEMVYYNSDGFEGTMCGNGGRCIVAFAKDLGLIQQETVFLAVDGSHDATIDSQQVKLGMIDVDHIDRDGDAYVLYTGSPHYVAFTESLKEKNVYQDGASIRNNDTYRQEGINVNFIEKDGDGYFCRTFERGVEDETYACGTGATAAAIAIAVAENRTGHQEIPIRVVGGQLYISFDRKADGTFRQVYLRGPAELVFQGTIAI